MWVLNTPRSACKFIEMANRVQALHAEEALVRADSYNALVV
jgi:hypothetical protein